MRRPVRAALLAFDLGSSSVKSLLINAETGAPIAIARRSTRDGADSLEQDADTWWHALCAAAHETLALAAAQSADPIEVRGIGVDGHGPSLTPVRADGSAAGAALMWRDRRSASDEVALQTILGRGGWLLGELPKARWLIRERPEVAAAATWLLSSWDALTLRLSGEAVSAFWDPARSVSPAQRSALLAAGLDERALPPEVFPGTRIGTLLPGPASDLGLPAGIPIAAGVNDGLAAVIGAGLTKPGLGVDVGGTAGGVAIASTPAEAQRINTALPGRLWSGPAPAPFGGGVILGGAFAGTGRLLEWVVTELLINDPEAAPDRRSELFGAAAALPLGADGLMAKPISNLGWSSPRSVDDAFVGRTAQHLAAHLVRAAIEGGALAVAHLIAPAIEAGLHVTEIRLSGPATGAAPGPLSGGTSLFTPLIQLRADLFGVPVVIGQNPEASAAGAAALAGVAAGTFANLREASDAVAAPVLRVEPNQEVHEPARDLIQRYGALSSATGVSGAGRRED
ncbi:MAG: xylulokinase [Candidatus Limnocylindrus sp.]